MLKKAILRPLAKVRLDLDAAGGIVPVQLRLDAEGDAVQVAEVKHVDDRLSEQWFEVLTTEGERWVLRFLREELRFILHSVESPFPERWRGWSQPHEEDPPPQESVAELAPRPEEP